MNQFLVVQITAARYAIVTTNILVYVRPVLYVEFPSRRMQFKQ